MAIFAPNHRPVGRSTHAAGTAGAHVRYITRAGAASVVLGENMPLSRDEARDWIDERELTDRKNGRVIDKLMLPLPIELDAAQRSDLVREFMLELGGGRVSWLAAFHDRDDDAHNPHAHVVLRDKDHETGKRVFGTSEKGSTERIRELWETAINQALEREGFDVRVDRRSLAEQGIDRQPGIHVGPNVYQMEERGVRPVSVALETETGRVINWPEIDQGRTRAEYQREIEQGNLERDRERGKSGEKSANLTPPPEPTRQREAPGASLGGTDIPDLSPEATQQPSYEVEAEPAGRYVPNFVLVDDGLTLAMRQAAEFARQDQQRAELEDENTPQHRQAKPQTPEAEAVRRQEPAHGPEPTAADNDARHAMEDLAKTDPLGMAARHGFHAGDRLKSPEDMRREMAMRLRSMAEDLEPDIDVKKPAPDLAEEKRHSQERSRLMGIVDAARERLADMALRLETAFSNMMAPRPTPEITKPAELERPRPTMKKPTPEPSLAERLIAAGRKLQTDNEPEQTPTPEMEKSRSIWDDFHRRRMRRPGEPEL